MAILVKSKIGDGHLQATSHTDAKWADCGVCKGKGNPLAQMLEQGTMPVL